MRFSSLILSVLAPAYVQAQVNGKPYGFALGVTGGGSAKAAVPKDINELKAWLADSTPRVIVLDKTYNFKGSEGRASSAGCYQKTCTPAQGGQTYIGTLSCGGSNMVATNINYDKAGTTPLIVGSNKSIVGSGNKGVIQGKGLRLPATSKNVIIQNVHITDMNPASVWGGDALSFEGNDGVWVDHVTFSKVGRMMVVSHFAASRITISNSEFNGVTTTSATCNNNHYWTAMFIGSGDMITLDRNHWHNLSGRAPKLGQDGTTTTVHATNNYFSNNKGHDFDIYRGTRALIEGNVFEAVTAPMTPESEKVTTIYNVPDSASVSACSGTLGRPCVGNSLTSSGKWPGFKSSTVLSVFSNVKNYLVTPVQPGNVKGVVVGHVGWGRT